MMWQLRNRGDQQCRRMADRHYSRRKIGHPQFVAAGRCVVLYAQTETGCAYWVTSWQVGGQCRHQWAGAWVCSAFRNEGAGLSSELITQAVAVTRWVYGDPPSLGFITFVNRKKTRAKKDPGYCYKMAGWQNIGRTKGGLIVLQLTPDRMPPPCAPLHGQLDLLGLQ